MRKIILENLPAFSLFVSERNIEKRVEFVICNCNVTPQRVKTTVRFFFRSTSKQEMCSIMNWVVILLLTQKIVRASGTYHNINALCKFLFCFPRTSLILLSSQIS